LVLARTIPDLGRFYDTDVPKRKVLGWYSLVFEGILTLTIVLKKWTIQSVPEIAYIPLTANVNMYSEMDSAKKKFLNTNSIQRFLRNNSSR
jgi:hypothetical protein